VLTLVVADAWQRRGVGAAIIRSAIDVARGEGVDHLLAELSPGNAPMRELLASEGFASSERDGVLEASLAVR
jgi:GNAT superfamily N-acetyltransferase